MFFISKNLDNYIRIYAHAREWNNKKMTHILLYMESILKAKLKYKRNHVIYKNCSR